MISILCPSRARPELLERSLESLSALADRADQLEFLVRIDVDDPARDAYSLMLAQCGSLEVVEGEPFGYAGQHLYNNELAAKAQGDWLMIWNDDAVMKTAGWDTLIDGHCMFGLLSLDCNQPRQYGCFPVVPRRWFELCGHLSLDCRVDTWLTEVSRAAGCFVEEYGVYIHHDRADLTGNNDDAVYQTRYDHPGFWTHFDEPEMVAARAHDAALIRGAM